MYLQRVAIVLRHQQQMMLVKTNHLRRWMEAKVIKAVGARVLILLKAHIPARVNFKEMVMARASMMYPVRVVGAQRRQKLCQKSSSHLSAFSPKELHLS
jgi:hypothetical protein